MHRYLQQHNGRASVESFSLTISHFLVLPPWYNFALHVKSQRFCCITYFLFQISIFPVCLLAHYTLASSLFFVFFFFSLPLPQLYSKLRCDDQPMLEHVEQLLSELGGEMEGEEGDPVLDDDYEPCSDEEEDDADAPMEH